MVTRRTSALLVALAIAVVAGAGLFLFREDVAAPPQRTRDVHESERPAALPSEGSATVEPVEPARPLAVESERTAPDAAPIAPPDDAIRVHLSGSDGALVMRVTGRAERPDAEDDGNEIVADGSFPLFTLRDAPNDTENHRYSVHAEFPFGVLTKCGVVPGSDVEFCVEVVAPKQLVHVRSVDGRPVPGAEVVLRAWKDSTDESIPVRFDEVRAKTDLEGDALLPALPCDLGFEVVAKAGSRRGSARRPCSSEPPAPLTVVLDRQPDRVVGRVVDATRCGLASTRVQVQRTAGLTGADGRFEITTWPGDFGVDVQVRREGYAPVDRFAPIGEEARAGGVVVDVGEIVLVDGVPFDVTVVDEARRPIEGAHVFLEATDDPPDDGTGDPPREICWLQATDAAGHAQFRWREKRAATVEITARGFAREILELYISDPARPPAPRTVTLRKGHPVTVDVDPSRLACDVEGALAGLAVTIEEDVVQMSRRKHSTRWRTSIPRVGERRFRIPDVAAGQYEIRIFGADVAAQRFRVGVSNGPSACSRLLESGGVVTGRTVDESGAPVAGAVVVLRNADWEELGTRHSERDGSFRFACLPAGSEGAFLIAIRERFDPYQPPLRSDAPTVTVDTQVVLKMRRRN